MLLSNFPRVSLAHLPTPLEPLPRLSAHLGGPEIWVKRDDCTGLATGGNKTRKLEFSMGQALEEGATTIITVGAVQSNHVRQTAAAACKLGMQCQILLEHRIADPGDLYRNSGNVLLDRLFGQLHKADNKEAAQAIEKAIWQLWAQSGSPTADALLQQATRAMSENAHQVALRILDTIVEIKPDFAEAWNKRATVYYLERQFDKSLADIEVVLDLEPRHFGALSGLGMIRRELGDERAALKAFRREVVKNVSLYGEMHRFIPAIASGLGVSVAELVARGFERGEAEEDQGRHHEDGHE